MAVNISYPHDLHRHPFALYRLPGEAVRLIIQSDPAVPVPVLPDLTTTQGFLFAPFDGQAHPCWFIRPDQFYEAASVNDLFGEAIIESFSDTQQIEKAIQGTDYTEYVKNARSLIAALKKGPLQKVVFSRTFRRPKPENFNELTFFNWLTPAYPDAFVYLVNIPGHEVWMGATPETLLHRHGDKLATMALAGTQPYNGQDLEEINWQRKERREQEIVSDFISEVLATYGLKPVISGPKSVQAGQVVHLRTDFSALLPPNFSRLNELVLALHPTPAVSGVPVRNALENIANYESYDRAFYTGFTGPVNLPSGDTRLFVNLRCVQLLQRDLVLYAGGGFTADSEAEKEWEETEWKFRTLLDVMEKA